jgi:hypothetical protein
MRLLLAKSQRPPYSRTAWWARKDSNLQPDDYERPLRAGGDLVPPFTSEAVPTASPVESVALFVWSSRLSDGRQSPSPLSPECMLSH